LFEWLKSEGGVAEDEMHRVFNCGIGMVIVVAAEHAAQAMKLLAASGEKVWQIGKIEKHTDGAQTVVV
jgi:phosphoribosylformylglycinamidine cyclo-ligase